MQRHVHTRADGYVGYESNEKRAALYISSATATHTFDAASVDVSAL